MWKTAKTVGEDFTDARRLLARLLPWAPETHAVLAVKEPTRDKPGQKPCHTLDSLVAKLRWGVENDRTGDTYMALASFRKTITNISKGKEYQRASRTRDNIACLKSFFMDLDVKDKGYASTGEALRRAREVHHRDGPA